MNLSDLAAKGADPLGMLMTMSLPAEVDDTWVAAFADGLGDDLRAFDLPLLGGDTVRAPMLSISITALGVVPTGRMVRRGRCPPRRPPFSYRERSATRHWDCSAGRAG